MTLVCHTLPHARHITIPALPLGRAVYEDAVTIDLHLDRDPVTALLHLRHRDYSRRGRGDVPGHSPHRVVEFIAV